MASSENEEMLRDADEMLRHAEMLQAAQEAEYARCEAMHVRARAAGEIDPVNLAAAEAELLAAHREIMAAKKQLADARLLERRERLRHQALLPVNAVLPLGPRYGGGPGVPSQHGSPVLSRAVAALGHIPTWVPRRICEEQIGDALEQIHRIARDAAPGWERQVRRKVLSTKFWVLVNAVREIASAVLGKKSA